MFCLIFLLTTAIAIKASTPQQEIYRIKEGESALIVCHFPTNATVCHWANNHGAIFTEAGRYEMSLENGKCLLKIIEVSYDADNGPLMCSISNKEVQHKEIIVLVTPEEEYLEIGGTLIKEHLIAADDYLPIGKTELEINCVVIGGYPSALIQWRLFDKDVTQDSVTVTDSETEHGLLQITSSYKIPFGSDLGQHGDHFNQEDFEKNVTCKIIQEAYDGGEKLFQVVVVKPYKTTNVLLEKQVVNGRQKLICKANGYPRPEFFFQRKSKDGSWSQSQSPKNTVYVEKSGKYICLANNKLNKERVSSNEIEINLKEPKPSNTGVIGTSIQEIFLMILMIEISLIIL